MVTRLMLEIETEMEEMDGITTNIWIEDNGFPWFQKGKWPNGGFS